MSVSNSGGSTQDKEESALEVSGVSKFDARDSTILKSSLSTKKPTKMMTNGPGPIRYRRSRRRRRNTTGNAVAEMSSATQNLGRMRWFRRPRRTKRVTFCDEEVTMLVTEAAESTEQVSEDANKPTGVLPQYQYTREELIQFQTHPDAKKRPDCLDPSFNNSRGVWDPERWHLDKKRSETPPDDDRASRGELNVDHKRRSGDPRERIRKEQDGIVLSPQRRSFNSGCFVTVNQSRRAESPLGKSDRDVSHRDMVPARRIGSGRILTRDVWDYRLERDKELDQQAEYGFQRSNSGVNVRDRERDERFERRSFGREFEREKERHRNDRLERNRFDRRRAYSDSKEEEPEWFSGGPTSQHDTIELRGFEDIPEEQGNRKQSPQAKSSKSNSRTCSSRKSSDVTVPQQQQNEVSATGRCTPMQFESTSLPSGSQSPVDEKSPAKSEDIVTSAANTASNNTTVPSMSEQQNSPTSEKQSLWIPERIEESGSRHMENSEFNLDDFLKIDALPLPGLLTNGAAMEGQAGSKFSQWFRRDSPVNQPESRRSSLQDELLNNIINDITEPNIVIPPISESNTYFAPISPAASTATVSQSTVGSSANNMTNSINSNNTGASDSNSTVGVKPTLLLEMLQRGGQSQANQNENSVPPMIRAPSIRDLEAAGKMQSVEELEARMRQQGLNIAKQNSKNMSHQQSHKKTEEDLAAFKKLLAQVSDGKVIPAAATNGAPHQKPQPLNFIQMLSKSQDSSVSGRAVTSGSTNVSVSTDRIGLGPMSGFGLNAQPSPTVNHNMVNSQTQPAQMQIPQDLVMKLLQVQQQQQQQQQRQQQQEMLNKLLASNQQQQSQATSRLGHIPVAVPVPTQFQVPPPPPSLSPLPPELQMMITNAQPSRELLQRPEAQAIIQGLKHGEITSQHLVQQLQNPAMQHRHREVLVSILKLQMQPGFSPRATSPHPHVQQPDLLHQMMLQQQQQQHQQQQLRIPSPLNNAYCQQPPVISPNMANNPNTLSVQHTVLPHRVPSPRELIAHTQNIMQSALIKKKLEEQRENYRKRQEMQQSLSPNVAGMSSNSTNNSGKMESSSPAKHLSSPTPLAFTPTSVLRKMTAEKESDAAASNSARTEGKTATSAANEQMKPQVSAQSSQHRSTVSNTQMRSQQSTAPQWSMAKHQGRPIVKGNANFQYAANVDFQQQQQQQQLHQQHRHNSMLSSSGSYSNNMPRSKMTMATPPPNLAPQFNSLMMMHRPPNVRAQTLQAHLAAHLHLQQQPQQQQQRNLSTPSLQQILMNQNFSNQGRGSGKSDSRMMRSQHSQAMSTGRQGQNMNLPVSRDMSTSPTSNQLARWFSPELLAQARAGQLPDMPPILSTQNMLSLEELERLQQASAAGS